MPIVVILLTSPGAESKSAIWIKIMLCKMNKFSASVENAFPSSKFLNESWKFHCWMLNNMPSDLEFTWCSQMEKNPVSGPSHVQTSSFHVLYVAFLKSLSGKHKEQAGTLLPASSVLQLQVLWLATLTRNPQQVKRFVMGLDTVQSVRSPLLTWNLAFYSLMTYISPLLRSSIKMSPCHLGC